MYDINIGKIGSIKRVKEFKLIVESLVKNINRYIVC